MMVMSVATVESEKVSNFVQIGIWARSTVLTVGAVIGGVCIVLALGALLFGFRPVVVVSGSMEPDIMTGAMIFERKVEAVNIHVGDVVTVPRPTGGLVTHRVVEAKNVGQQQASLVLKGDANQVADAQPYVVEDAYVVVTSVPKVGAVVEGLRTTNGAVFMLLLWLSFVLVYLWKPKRVSRET